MVAADSAVPAATSEPPRKELRTLLAGEHHDPHSVLGAHPHPQGTA
ncbi:MAG: GlgB N-terminal domain-containing protein, partial [Pseudonocardiaceae bacterium]